jgi:hypothetical protein
VWLHYPGGESPPLFTSEFYPTPASDGQATRAVQGMSGAPGIGHWRCATLGPAELYAQSNGVCRAPTENGRRGESNAGGPAPPVREASGGWGCLLVKRRRPPRGAASREPVLEGDEGPWGGRGPRSVTVPSSGRAPGAGPGVGRCDRPGPRSGDSTTTHGIMKIFSILQTLKIVSTARAHPMTMPASGPMDIGPVSGRLDPGRRFNTQRPVPSAGGEERNS